MSRSVTSAKLETAQARIHVYTYQYEQPSSQIRSPKRDTLALFQDRPLDSAGFFRTADRTSRLMPLGALMIVPAGASISASGPGGERQLAVCTMTQGILPTGFDIDDQRHLAMCSDIRDPNVRGGMQRLAQEAAAPGFAADILVDGLTTALQIDLARYFALAATRQPVTSGGLAPWQLRRLEEYLRASEGMRIRIADLAAVAEVSAGHLVRAFKRTTGRTVHQYVDEVRLTRARSLLAETAVPLKQVAARLGFGTPSSFSLAFRRATGLTPGRYRQESSIR